MSSIAKSTGCFQTLPRRKIEVFESGVFIPKQGMNFVPNCLTDKTKRKERGSITSFSYHARQRLRRALVEFRHPNAYRLGFTLTLPWRDVVWDDQKTLDQFRECFNLFSTKFRQAFPKSSAIFRVELQQRKAPHIHAIWYLDKSEAIKRGWFARTPAEAGAPDERDALLSLPFLANTKISSFWTSSVPVGPVDNIRGFLDHGARVDRIASDGQMFRYLADHASKSKQAQLGYRGKQWGFIGRRNLVKSTPDEFAFRRGEDGARGKAVLLRTLRKVCRYRVQAPGAAFGSKYVSSRRSVGAFYVSGRTARLLFGSERVSCGLVKSRSKQMRFNC